MLSNTPACSEDRRAWVKPLLRELVKDEDNSLWRHEVQLLSEIYSDIHRNLGPHLMLLFLFIERFKPALSHRVQDPSQIELCPDFRIAHHEFESAIVEAVLDLDIGFSQRVHDQTNL